VIYGTNRAGVGANLIKATARAHGWFEEFISGRVVIAGLEGKTDLFSDHLDK